MPNRDLKSNINFGQSLPPKALTASANGTGVDLQGFDGACCEVSFGTWTDGTHTPKLQESVDNSTFTDVAAGDQIGTFAAVSGAGGSNTVQRVGYIGSQHYIRTVMTVAGATTGALSASTIIRGYPAQGNL
jgi:hypothetical protein